MKILTDSAADLTPQDVKEHNIQIAPLYINFPKGQIRAGDISPDDFYDKLRGIYPEIPTTAMPGAGEFARIYQGAAEEGELLSLHISGGLSGTVEAARLGVEQCGAEVTGLSCGLGCRAGVDDRGDSRTPGCDTRRHRGDLYP
jgi:fatty acid-binding protein DegV